MASVVSTLVQVHVARFEDGRWQHLLLRRRDDEVQLPELWQCITGGIRAGETAFDAARRELEEETGLQPQQWWCVPIVSAFYSRSADAMVMVPVFGVCVSSDDALGTTPEHAEHQWLTLERALEMLAIPQHREGARWFEWLLTESHFRPQLVELYRLQP